MSEKAVSDGQATEEDHLEEEVETSSHDDLSAAWDHMQAVDTEPEEEEPAEEPTEEPDEPDEEPVEEPDGVPEPEPTEELDHGEKSRLGRKVKRLETHLEERDQKLDEALSRIERLTGHIEALSGGADPSQEPSLDDLDDDQILTAADYKRLRDRELKEASEQANKQEQQLKEYQSGYYEALLEYEDDPDYEQVYDLLTKKGSKFNRIVSGDPVADVRVNAAEARLELVSKAGGKQSNPNLKGKKAEGTKVGGDDVVKTKEPAQVDTKKLSPAAQELLKHVARKGRDPQAVANRALGEKK